MLFTVAGSVAMPAQMISLEEAGLEERADLQEWVLSNPAILGPAVKVITFEFDGVPTASGAGRDRIWVLGLGADGRLVVAELKSSRTPDTDVSAVKYAAMASRILPESLADHYARFQSRRQSPVTLDEAFAELQAHAPDLTQESLRRPRIVLLARDFSSLVTASVVWLSEMGLDISLVQISAFRSYVYGHAGSGNVPMISVSQLYPLREVEEFTISPERQLAKEMADSKRRVQDASTVRRLVTSESVADGTIFTIAPRDDMSFELRSQLEEWLHADPARRTAHWQNVASAALVWDADKAPYTPAGLVRHIVELATGISRDFFGDPVVARSRRMDAGRARRAAQRGQGRALPRVLVPLARSGAGRPQPLDPDVDSSGPELHHAAVTHQGHALRARLRGRRQVALGLLHRPRLPRASTAQFEVIQAQREVVESIYDAPLSWERLPDRAAFRIADYSEGEVTTVEDYAFYIDWMIDSQERLRRAIEGVLHGGAPQSEDFDRR